MKPTKQFWALMVALAVIFFVWSYLRITRQKDRSPNRGDAKLVEALKIESNFAACPTCRVTYSSTGSNATSAGISKRYVADIPCPAVRKHYEKALFADGWSLHADELNHSTENPHSFRYRRGEYDIDIDFPIGAGGADSHCEFSFDVSWFATETQPAKPGG